MKVILLFVFGFFIPYQSQVFAQELDSASFKSRFDSIRRSIPDSLPYLIQRADSLLSESEKSGENEFISRSNYLLGLLYYFNSKHYISQKYYLEAAENEFTKANPRLAKGVWNNIGINYDLSNDIIRSLDAYKKAADYAAQIGDSSTIGRTLINRGLLYRKQRKFDEAKKVTFQALDYYYPKRETGNHIGYVMLCYQNLAIYELESGNPDKCLEYNEKALPISRDLEDKVTEHSILSNMVNAYIQKRQYKKAEIYLDLALKDWKPEDWLELSERMWNQQAMIELEQGNFKIARIALDSSEVYAKRYQMNQYEDVHAETEVKYYAKLGNYEQFQKSLDWFKSELEKKYDEQRQKTFEEMLVLYEQEKIVSENQLLSADVAIKNSRILYLSIITIMVSIGAFIIFSLYRRVSKQYNILYQQTVEMASSSCLPKPKFVENIIEKSSELQTVITSEQQEEQQDAMKRVYLQVEEIMNVDKIYLNKKLALADLAQHLGTNENYISRAVNEHAKMNVSNFINSYRVKFATNLMLKDDKNRSIEQILDESGFNSRTTFYRIFSEFTGLKPTEFLQEHRKNK